MTKHIYSIGQQVSFGGRVVTYLKRTGVLTITKLLPPVGADLQYRIKSEHEAHERVAIENELHSAELEKSIVAAEIAIIVGRGRCGAHFRRALGNIDTGGKLLAFGRYRRRNSRRRSRRSCPRGPSLLQPPRGGKKQAPP